MVFYSIFQSTSYNNINSNKPYFSDKIRKKYENTYFYHNIKRHFIYDTINQYIGDNIKSILKDHFENL